MPHSSRPSLSGLYSNHFAGSTLAISNLLIIPGAFLDPITDGAIVIKDGRIEAIGTSADLTTKFASASWTDGRGKLILPGLFNAHTHVAMGFFRGLGHGKDEMIETYLFPAEKNLTPELLEPLSYSYIFDGLRSGVTSFVDHYYFSDGIGYAFDRLGVRGWIGETIADLGGAFAGIESFTRAKHLIETSPHSSRVKHVIAPHAADTLSKQLLTEVSHYAKREDIPLHMHLSQTPGELQRVRKREKMSAVSFAESCEALGPKSLVVHLTSASAEDLQIIASSGSTIGWCPSSTVIYDRLAPVSGFFTNKIPLAIGTDCPASCDHADVLSELRTAALFAKDRGVDMASLSPDHLLAMATTIPAKVLGVDKELGSLEVGKRADLVVFDISLSSLPIENPLANVIFSMGARDVLHVMVEGKWVLWNRDTVMSSQIDLSSAYQNAVSEIQRRVRSTGK